MLSRGEGWTDGATGVLLRAARGLRVPDVVHGHEELAVRVPGELLPHAGFPP